MVDPRIYRGFMVVIAFAVIVFGFSLQRQAGPDTTRIAPGQFFTGAQGQLSSLTQQYPRVEPGSVADGRLASYLRQQLSGRGASGISGFQVRSQQFSASTPRGPRLLQMLTATRPGLGSGMIVIVTHRDAATASGGSDLSGTVVLLELARALSGETLSRSVMLVSTSGELGDAGTTRLAAQLAGQPVDAVIALGNLGGSSVRNPVVVPWSGTDRLAPPMLVRTVSSYVASQAAVNDRGSGLAGQVARLALPFSVSEQAPFAAAGIPAVLLSLSGDRPASEPQADATAPYLAGLGTAVLQSLNALDHGPAVGSPSPYLVIRGQIVPLWAVQLLVLALILPAAAATLDAVARARRRGHSLLRWVGWVLAGATPFLAGLVAVLIARGGGMLSFAPSGAVAGAVATPRSGDVVVLALVLAVALLGFIFLRPLCLRLLARTVAEGDRRPETPAADAAAVALSVVMCVLAVVVWALDPFAALLLVPALHLWLWLAQQEVRDRPWAVFLTLVAGALPGLLMLFFYANVYGLTPLELLWSLLLMQGAAMPVASAVCWSVALGCLGSAVIIGLRAARGAAAAPEPVVTVRGPASYAGPGSLGGTKSALRR